MIYGVALLAIGLWPTHVDRNVDVLDSPPARWLQDRGISPDGAYALIEMSANVALFLPLGVLAMMLFPRLTWTRTVLTALLVSGLIELLQALARPGRTANATDVLANALGAAMGAALVLGWRSWRSSR